MYLFIIEVLKAYTCIFCIHTDVHSGIIYKTEESSNDDIGEDPGPGGEDPGGKGEAPGDKGD